MVVSACVRTSVGCVPGSDCNIELFLGQDFEFRFGLFYFFDALFLAAKQKKMPLKTKETEREKGS